MSVVEEVTEIPETRRRKPMVPVDDVPLPVVPPVAVTPPSELPPTREELLKRLRAKRDALRGTPRPEITKSAAKELAKTIAAQPVDDSKMGDMQKVYEDCGGDMRKLCKKMGISTKFLPIIEKAARSVTDGQTMQEALRQTTQQILHMSNKRR